MTKILPVGQSTTLDFLLVDETTYAPLPDAQPSASYLFDGAWVDIDASTIENNGRGWYSLGLPSIPTTGSLVLVVNAGGAHEWRDMYEVVDRGKTNEELSAELDAVVIKVDGLASAIAQLKQELNGAINLSPVLDAIAASTQTIERSLERLFLAIEGIGGTITIDPLTGEAFVIGAPELSVGELREIITEPEPEPEPDPETLGDDILGGWTTYDNTGDAQISAITGGGLRVDFGDNGTNQQVYRVATNLPAGEYQVDIDLKTFGEFEAAFARVHLHGSPYTTLAGTWDITTTDNTYVLSDRFTVDQDIGETVRLQIQFGRGDGKIGPIEVYQASVRRVM